MLNAALGFLQESKAEQAVAALARMTAENASVVRDGNLEEVPDASLVCGELLVLNEGDSVGADARLVEAAPLRRSGARARFEYRFWDSITCSRPMAGMCSHGQRAPLVRRITQTRSPGVARITFLIGCVIAILLASSMKTITN